MRRFYIFTFLLICFACSEFQPSGDNIVEVDDITTEISVGALGFADTLYAAGVIDLQYQVDISDGEFAFLKVFVDSQVVDTSYNDSFISFDTRPYPDLPHRITLEAWAYTRTGSLADALDRELVMARSSSFVIRFDNRTAVTAAVRSVGLNNGRILVTWRPTCRPDFVAYEVRKNGQAVAQINDCQQASWVDENYIGGETTYRVIVIREASQVGGPPNASGAINLAIPSIVSSGLSEDGTLEVAWSRCQPFHNFVSYEVLVEGEVVYTTNDVNDTTLSGQPAIFGSGQDYQIRTSPGRFDQSVLSDIVKVTSGDPCPAFDRLQYRPDQSSIYLITDDDRSIGKIYRLDASTLETLNTSGGGGDVGIGSDNSFIVSGNQNNIHTANLLTFSQVSTSDLDAIAGYDVWVRDDVIFVPRPERTYYQAVRAGATNMNEGIHLVDLTTDTFLGQYTGRDSDNMAVRQLSVSHDGEFLFVRDRSNYDILQWDGGNFVRLRSMPSDNQFIFYPGQNEGVRTDGTIIDRHSLPDFTRLDVIPLTEELFDPSIDVATNSIGGVTANGDYRIYNLDSGELVYELKVTTNDGGTYFLANSTIFSTLGFCLQLNFD